MNWSFVIKINILLLALIGVVVLMRLMQSETGPGGLAAILETQPPTSRRGSPAPEPTGEVIMMDWCDTRIVALERPGKPTIRQVKLKWYAGEALLEFIPVEKWFGRNCRVRIDRVSSEEFNSSAAKPAMTVKFIKGEPEPLLVAGDVYRWRQEVFRSAELDQALVELDSLPRQQGIDKN